MIFSYKYRIGIISLYEKITRRLKIFIKILLSFSVELGDYDPNIHVGNYVTEMRLLLRQTDTIEARIQVTRTFIIIIYGLYLSYGFSPNII